MTDPVPAQQANASAINPPSGGAIVRMYRIGHGDCFLIAFPRPGETRPFFVLIDCGYKPGSPQKLKEPTKAKDIAADILETTKGFIDVVVATHEHQDHLNGFTSANFPSLRIGEVWFAWTEDPDDEVAGRLRKKFRDRLLGLMEARDANGVSLVPQVQCYLEMELGEDLEPSNATAMAAAGDPENSANKLAMQFLRSCSDRAPKYLLPHGKPIKLPGTTDVRAYVLGPPHDFDKINDLNPEGDESFGDDDHRQALGAGAMAPSAAKGSPFPRRHVIPLEGAFGHPDFGEFFKTHFGEPTVAVLDAPDSADALSNAEWRRIGAAAAEDADALAIAMNNATNNSSLVLAFEMSKDGKTLLFAGDAQAGNWRSWSDDSFTDGDKEITAKDLLGRCVLYKVGHHGSHNATLNGSAASTHPSLAWMGMGERGGEFAAMITAVEAWAHQQPKPDWNHPFPPIKEALEQKARRRVLQTDTDAPDLPPAGAEAATWRAFRNRVRQTPLYFELTIEG